MPYVSLAIALLTGVSYPTNSILLTKNPDQPLFCCTKFNYIYSTTKNRRIFSHKQKTLSQCTFLPKLKTNQGLQYLINQESHLKMFLTDEVILSNNLTSIHSILSLRDQKRNKKLKLTFHSF